MGEALSVRTATPEDTEALLDLYTHLSPDDAQCPIDAARDALARFADYPGSAVLIGELGGEIAVSCTLIVIPNLTRGGAPYALIENVVTRSDLRGRGYGTAILDHASARAWEHGCYKIMLSTGSRHRSTLAFYERAGFEQSRTGFQKRRIPPRSE